MSNVQRVTLTATGFFQGGLGLVTVETFQTQEEGAGLPDSQLAEYAAFGVEEVEALTRPLCRGTFAATAESPDQAQSPLLGHWIWDSLLEVNQRPEARKNSRR